MRILYLMVLVMFLNISAWSQSESVIKLSVKVFLNPETGNPPNGFSETELELIIDEMNLMMSSYRRGMVFRLDETIELGGIGDPLSEEWFAVNIGGKRDDLEAAAEASPVEYEWRESAINIYLNGATSGLAGACSFSTFIYDEIVFIRVPGGFKADVFLHEIGHFFDLGHTHVGDNPDTCNTSLPVELWTPGDDGIDDTLEDHHCWDKDEMSQYHFNQDYADLTEEDKQAVDFTFHNIMSYHFNEYALSEQQMNKWADKVRTVPSRDIVVNGTTYYVNKNSQICLPGAICSGRPYDEFLTVDDALNTVNASGGDVIVTRKGTYDLASSVLSQPVLILATREGDVILK